MFAAFIAIVVANTPLSVYYDMLIQIPVAVSVGDFAIDKPLLLWINDGMMAVFFLLVGLELKREVLEGELSDIKKVILPALGAVGGMVVPAGIYLALNYDDPVAVKGWAIPAATDIAFALGILSLLGSRIPTSIKVFLTSLAIFDDIGAILIIAIFYTAKISFGSLMVAAVCIVILTILSRRRVEDMGLYILVGLVMWVALLKSGVHATLAGVILAMFIPARSRNNPEISPLKEMEHNLHSTVAFVILPVFAFANAGISLSGVGIEQMLHGVPLGVTLGLFIGKQVGIFLICWMGIKIGMARMPEGMSWMSLYGTALLCGVGFTMSLFVGSLAFEETGVNMLFDERIGIIGGSLLSGIAGYLVLRFSLNKQ